MRGSKPTYEELEKRVRALEKEVKKRQQAREKAEKHEEFLQGIIDNAPVMIVCYDSQINILMLNREFTRCLGWTQEDAQKMDLMAACCPDPEYREMARKYMMEAVMGWRDFELTKKNGDILHSSWSNCRLSDGTQIGIGIDITQRRQAEEALKMIEYEKGLILDSMSEIVIYYSCTNLKIEWTNRAAGESVGLSPNKLVGKHCYEIWHNRNEPCDGCPVVKSFETGKPEEDERNTPDGRKWYVRSYPVISAKGAIEGIVEVVQNITERKRAEKVLRESKEFSSSLLNNAPNPILVINQDTSLRYVNTTLEKLTGFSSAELIGRKAPYPWWTEETLQKTSKDLEKAMREGAKRLEELFQKKNGERFWVEITSVPVRMDGDFKYYLANWVDITERKRAEEQIKASLREKEVLLQEIHHRVKNNLQVISSLLNRKSKAIKYKKDAEVFRECQNFVGVMSIVHEKLYQNKNLASINFKDYIATVARELVRAYYPTKPDKVALKFELEDVSLGIDSAIPLGLVFNELITNSLKHAFPKSKKGEIRVSLHVRDEHEIELVVSDNGIGIPKDLDYRTDETYGLYLVTGLVEKQLQGKIEISGKPVVAGTEVKITFQEDNP